VCNFPADGKWHGEFPHRHGRDEQFRITLALRSVVAANPAGLAQLHPGRIVT
jgi:hypothetical protein